LLNVTEKDADTCKCELRRSGGISYFKANLTRVLPMPKSAEGIQAFLTVILPSPFFLILKAASFLDFENVTDERLDVRQPFPEHSRPLPFDYEDAF